jgi:parallel beta-helix repeat protein
MSQSVIRITQSILLVFTLLSFVQIQTARAVGTIYIRADGTVEPSTASINRKMDVYTLTADISASIVVEKSNVVIDGNGFVIQGDGNGCGFLLIGIGRVVIRNTIIRGFDYGIYLDSASYTTVCFNEITTNDLDGIGLRDSTNNRISWNNIMANNWFGIGVYYSSGNTFDGNNMTGNYDGIDLYDSANNVLLGNRIAANNHYGLGLYASSSNLIFHNNFENNERQIFTESSVNSWDNGYPNGGNFWSDFAALDLFSGPYQNLSNADNISDTPYILAENNKDRYPLMKPFGEIRLAPDLNGDGKINILDITLVGSAFGSNPSHTRWNPKCDFDGNGLINIIDITLIAKDYGKSF